MKKIKEKFLLNSLVHVPFDGWTKKTVKFALNELNLDENDFDGMFPDGIEGLVKFYLQNSDNIMVADYKKISAKPKPTHLKIKKLIILKLSNSIDNKDVIRKTLIWLSKPNNSALAVNSLYNTVDLMWRTAGDISTDFNFYTKRMILSGVYTSTLLAFLGDESFDMDKTEKFLDRRLNDISKITEISNSSKMFAKNIFNLTKNFRNFSY